jgi:hypothetical protein
VTGTKGLLWDVTEDDLRAAYPLPPSTKGAIPTKEGEPFDRLPSDLRKVRLWLDVRLWEKFDPARFTPGSMLSWRQEFLREFQETADKDAYPLGNLPVVVVSSNPPATEAERNSRGAANAPLDRLSGNSVHITAAGAVMKFICISLNA